MDSTDKTQLELWFHTDEEFIDALKELKDIPETRWSCETLIERGLILQFTRADDRLATATVLDSNTGEAYTLDSIDVLLGYTTKDVHYARVEGNSGVVFPVLDLLMYARFSGKMVIAVFLNSQQSEEEN